jgi:ribonuclease HI
MFTLFCDGSCLGNPGPGGYAYILRDEKGREIEYAAGQDDTTNNRMELLAAIQGLKKTPAGSKVHVVTDSQYVIKGMTEWLKNWVGRGWKTANNKAVKNKDLWEQMYEVASERRVTWEWTEGHAGHPENERCDELARSAAEAISY